MPAYVTSTKIGIRHIRNTFPPAFCMHIIKNLQNSDRIIPYLWFKCVRKCVFEYMLATPMLFRGKMINIAYLEKTLCTELQNKDQTQNPVHVMYDPHYSKK